MTETVTIQSVPALAPGMLLCELVHINNKTKGGIIIPTVNGAPPGPGGAPAQQSGIDTCVKVHAHKRRLRADPEKNEPEPEWKAGDYLVVGGMGANIIVDGKALLLMQDVNVLCQVMVAPAPKAKPATAAEAKGITAPDEAKPKLTPVK